MLIREGLLRAGVDHSHSETEVALRYFITALISVSTDITVGTNS
jgi:hypothetical protein